MTVKYYTSTPNLPIRDVKLDQQSNGERDESAGDSGLELTQYVTVNQDVSSIPEQKNQRSEQEEVERRVNDYELGTHQHFSELYRKLPKSDERTKNGARFERNSMTDVPDQLL